MRIRCLRKCGAGRGRTWLIVEIQFADRVPEELGKCRARKLSTLPPPPWEAAPALARIAGTFSPGKELTKSCSHSVQDSFDIMQQ